MADIIFSVDVETSGPTPGAHQLLSIGAVAYDAQGVEYDSFSANLTQQPGKCWDPDTQQWWSTQKAAWEALQHDQITLAAAVERFDHFIRALCVAGNSPVFLADPVIFDYPWIDSAYREANRVNPFHFNSKCGLKVIDLTSFAMGGLGIENTQRRATLRGFDTGLSPHTHVAVEDARHQGELFFKIAKHIGWPKS